MTRKLPLLAASLMLTAIGAQAVLLVDEPFDYGSSDLQSGYGSWSDGTSNARYEGNSGNSSWTGDSDYVADNAGGYFAVNSFNSWRGAQLDFGTALSGEFWVSVLMNEQTTGLSGIGLALEMGGYDIADFDGFLFGASGNQNLAGAQNGGALFETAPPTAVSGSWGLFVAKITINVAADDSISLWSFDSTDSFGLTEASLGVADFTSNTVDYGDSVTDVWIGGYDSGAPSGAGSLDNVRISDLAGDSGLFEVLQGEAIPEPSMLGMLFGAAAFMALMFRRR